MSRAKYREYLQSPEWQVRRQWALARAGYRCQVCNGQGVLDCHHRTYERVGREHPEDVTVLCRRCHQLFHGYEDDLASENWRGMLAGHVRNAIATLGRLGVLPPQWQEALGSAGLFIGNGAWDSGRLVLDPPAPEDDCTQPAAGLQIAARYAALTSDTETVRKYLLAVRAVLADRLDRPVELGWRLADEPPAPAPEDGRG